jgi:hypothetical protein
MHVTRPELRSPTRSKIKPREPRNPWPADHRLSGGESVTRALGHPGHLSQFDGWISRRRLCLARHDSRGIYPRHARSEWRCWWCACFPRTKSDRLLARDVDQELLFAITVHRVVGSNLYLAHALWNHYSGQRARKWLFIFMRVVQHP